MATFSYSPASGTKIPYNGSTTFKVSVSGSGFSSPGMRGNLLVGDKLVWFEEYNTSTVTITINPSTLLGSRTDSTSDVTIRWEERACFVHESDDFWGSEWIYFTNIPVYTTVNYLKCAAPTSVIVSPSSMTASGSARLSWSGAKGGPDNPIKGYTIYRSTSANGQYTALTTITTPSTSGSITVTSQSTKGASYYYKVKTLSSVSGYDSNVSTAYAVLTTVDPTACGTPTTCAIDSTLSLVATTLRWSGATSGVSNNINRYEVQRRSRTHKGEWGAWSAFQITSGTSLSVSPPATAGHYYQYRVRAQGTAGEAYYSGWKESTNTLRKAHQTVPEFTDPTLVVGLTDVKAVHITELQEALNNILLPFMDENKIAFIAIDKNSDAKHWGDHVEELKTAIDSTGVSHDSWVVMKDEVTADVIEQIRRIVRAM